jgi:hypothetical protein
MLPTGWDTFPLMSPPPIEAAKASRVQNLRAALIRLWSPKGLAELVARDWPGQATGEAAVLFWRARLLTWPLGFIGLAIFTASLIGWFAGYRTIPAAVPLTGGSMMAASLAVLHAFRLWLLFKLGGWSRRRGGPVRRAEQPVRFWIWAAASSSILVVLVSGAGYLLWSLISALSRSAV